LLFGFLSDFFFGVYYSTIGSSTVFSSSTTSFFPFLPVSFLLFFLGSSLTCYSSLTYSSTGSYSTGADFPFFDLPAFDFVTFFSDTYSTCSAAFASSAAFKASASFWHLSLSASSAAATLASSNCLYA
jgi:hypothetical protein